MNEECTQIAIPACTEPEEPWRDARQVFPRDQYQTGRQLAAVLELGHVTNRGDQRGGTQCSGQGKTATQLSHQRQWFIVIGTNRPEIRMLPSASVEHLDGIDDLVPRLLRRGLITMPWPLACDTAKASLSHRIGETLTLLTPTTDDPLIGSDGLGGLTGVLTAAVRMVPEPHSGSATAKRHRQGLLDQGGLHRLVPRPAHHVARRHVHQD